MGYIHNTHRLDLKSGVPDMPDLVNLYTILHMTQKKEIGSDFLPLITITSTTLSIIVIYRHNYCPGEISPERPQAFLDSDHPDDCIQSDSFILTYEHPE